MICEECKHCGCDPDGLYCGHKKSLEISEGFGSGLQAAKNLVCTKDNPLFELADEETLKW